MNKIAAAKKFVARHRVALAVTATTVICISVHRAALEQHNEFLKEHDLYEEFYALAEED